MRPDSSRYSMLKWSAFTRPMNNLAREAENEVKVTTQRLALLHLAFSKTIVDTLVWKPGKKVVLDRIKLYGEYFARAFTSLG